MFCDRPKRLRPARFHLRRGHVPTSNHSAFSHATQDVFPLERCGRHRKAFKRMVEESVGSAMLGSRFCGNGAREMFCPECGSLSYPDSNGWVKCPDYKCGYEGPLSGTDGKGSEFTDPMTGKTIDLSKARATTSSKSLKHLTEVVEEEGPRGTLRVGDYICPKCDGNRTFVELRQTRASDEPETKICTCETCGHRWREYQ